MELRNVIGVEGGGGEVLPGKEHQPGCLMDCIMMVHGLLHGGSERFVTPFPPPLPKGHRVCILKQCKRSDFSYLTLSLVSPPYGRVGTVPAKRFIKN